MPDAAADFFFEPAPHSCRRLTRFVVCQVGDPAIDLERGRTDVYNAPPWGDPRALWSFTGRRYLEGKVT